MFEGLFQPTHLIIILAIVLIIFGPGKLPEIGGAIGRGIREFKRSTSVEPEHIPDTVATQNQLSSPHTMCSACHAENPPTNKFCGRCGKELA